MAFPGFKTKDPHFHLAVDPTNHTASPEVGKAENDKKLNSKQ